MKPSITVMLLTLVSPWVAAEQTGPVAVSERDFMSDIPVVLSVSRLAQPVDEAPGAVTILDRHFIRISGARDITDLLRLVPGFQTTTSFETDAPMASYHGRNDDWANRIQVLVDGRSVYSGHLQGSAGLGLQALAMDDIERIEILRGSNSAAYGARAFLGVINIISRDVRETAGSRARLSAGDSGVADAFVSTGWGDSDHAYRVSADTRGDMGLRSAYGVNRVSRVNVTGVLALDSGLELELRAGSVGIDAGRGDPKDKEGNAARNRFIGAQFVQADWHKILTPEQDLKVSFSHTENTHKDVFPYLKPGSEPSGFYGIPVDFSGHEVNQAISLQHTTALNPQWRVVWGTELRKELLTSPSTFYGRGSVATDFQRLFGNVEWKPLPDWILNSGVMLEQSELGGKTVSPRLMLNWHVSQGHTLRAGVSTAFRPPSAFEKYADVRYYGWNGGTPEITVSAKGNVGPEKIESRELGYNLALPARGVSGDVRIFDERITDGIERSRKIGFPNELISPQDYLNTDNYRIQGLEYQLQWKPSAPSLLMVTQTWTDIFGIERLRVLKSAARYAMSLTGSYGFNSGYVVSLMHAQSEDIALMSPRDTFYNIVRTDVRIAKPFRLSGRKAELSLVIQNLDQPVRDGDSKFFFDRRAFVTLKAEL
ncbi:TonB-dependent receptor, plug domain containing protein [Comamonadaceae bacterium]